MSVTQSNNQPRTGKANVDDRLGRHGQKGGGKATRGWGVCGQETSSATRAVCIRHIQTMGGGDDGRRCNRRHRRTIDGAPVDRGRRMRIMRPGSGLYGTTRVGDVVAGQEANRQ